jgi:hypothetical protein
MLLQAWRVASDASLLRQQLAVDLSVKAVARMQKGALFSAWAGWHGHTVQMKAVRRLREALDRKLLTGASRACHEASVCPVGAG